MDDCLFCKIAKKEINSKIIYEDDKVLCFMDINPICDAHLLIIPKNHYTTIYDLDNEMLKHLYDVSKIVGKYACKVTGENGYGLSFNYGDKQEIKHVHLHLIPNHKKPASKSVDEIYNKIMEVKNEEVI